MVNENITPGLYRFSQQRTVLFSISVQRIQKCSLLTSRMFQLAEGNDKISFYRSFDPIRRNRIKIFCLAVFVFTWKDWGDLHN